MVKSASRLVLAYVIITGLVMITFDLMSQLFSVDNPGFLQMHLLLDVFTVAALFLVMRRTLLSRDRTEEMLRFSEQRLANLLVTAPDAIIALDAEQRIFLFNQGAERIFGYTAAEVLGQPLDVLLPDRFVLRHREHIRNFSSGSESTRHMSRRPEVVGRRRDGTEFPAEASISRLTLNGQISYFAIVHDIAERKQAEAALLERETQYRRIFETSSDGLMIAARDGTLVEANPAFCDMLGYTAAELVGRNGRQYLPPDQSHQFDNWQAALRRGETPHSQTLIRRKDGSTFHANIYGSGLVYNGQPHLLISLQDVTEQVAAYQLLEQRVQERTRDLTMLLDLSRNVASTLELHPLLGVILDQIKGSIDYGGALVLALNGADIVPLDYRGSSPTAALLKLPRTLNHDLCSEVMRSAQAVIIDDAQADTRLTQLLQALRDQTGLLTQARSWLGVPLINKERVIGLLGLEHPDRNFFTPRHAQLAMAIGSQAAVAIENARLYEQAQRVAALEERQHLARELHDSLSQTLYGIALGAHSVRTWQDIDRDKAQEALNYLLSLTEAGMTEMRALIFELRPESLATEGLISALTKQVAAVRTRNGLEVVLAVGDEPVLELEVKEALYRIAQEALHNTVKHAEADRVAVNLFEDNGQVVLEIIDNGIGFDPDQSFPGHLGLRSMRERASRLNGELRLNSRPGHGTHLMVRFPK